VLATLLDSDTTTDEQWSAPKLAEAARKLILLSRLATDFGPYGALASASSQKSKLSLIHNPRMTTWMHSQPFTIACRQVT
jgi:hypothetical protein